MPLGSVASFPTKKKKLSLASDDVIVFMSDGFAERFNAAGRCWTTRRRTLSSNSRAPNAAEIIEHFVETGERWAGGRRRMRT